MQRLSSFSCAQTHVQYRAQSLLPCPFYHKSQSNEASNHKSTDEATIISLFADSASPSSSSRNHLTALVLLVVVLVKDFLDANKAVVSACRRHLRTTYRGLPQRCSPSNALRQTTKKSRRHHRNGKGIQIQLLPPFFCTQGQYIKITICKGPLTLIEAKLMGLATKFINIPCMHAEVRRLVCMALH